MTFLALGWWPALALGAATAAVIAWLFFLKLRHPRLPVASLLLWRRALDEHRPQALVERLRRLISLALALAIGLLLALAPARPATGTGAAVSGADLTVVVDTSPSMASRGADGLSRLDRAVMRAREIIVGASPATAVGLADTAGAVHVSHGEPRSELLRALDRLAVGPPGTRALSLGGRSGRVVFVTDGVMAARVPADAARISVFEPVDNVGIVAFDIRPMPASPRTFEAFIDVVNRSPGPKTVSLTIGNATGTWLARTLAIEADGHLREVVDASGFPSGPVRAAVVTAGDGLALDDVAFAWMPSRAPARTVLVSDGNRPLETLLAIDEGVELITISPAQFQELPGADLYVFDRFTPSDPPEAPALLIHPTDADWLAPLVRITGEVAGPSITSWAAHPVLTFVPGTDIRIERTLGLRLAGGAASAGARAIATAGETALIVTAVRPVKRVIVGFDFADSDFPYHVGFPLFVRNAVSWLVEARPAIGAAPGTVRVPWPDAEIVTAADEAVPARRALDGTVFEAPAPGLYVARRGAERQPIVVRLADPAVSDVNRSSLAGTPAGAEEEARGRELWVIMLVGAVALASVEWWTFHRRITV